MIERHFKFVPRESYKAQLERDLVSGMRLDGWLPRVVEVSKEIFAVLQKEIGAFGRELVIAIAAPLPPDHFWQMNPTVFSPPRLEVIKVRIVPEAN